MSEKRVRRFTIEWNGWKYKVDGPPTMLSEKVEVLEARRVIEELRWVRDWLTSPKNPSEGEVAEYLDDLLTDIQAPDEEARS